MSLKWKIKIFYKSENFYIAYKFSQIHSNYEWFNFLNIDNQLCRLDGIRTRTVIPDQGIFLPHLLLHKLT